MPRHHVSGVQATTIGILPGSRPTMRRPVCYSRTGGSFSWVISGLNGHCLQLATIPSKGGRTRVSLKIPMILSAGSGSCGENCTRGAGEGAT